METDAQPSCPGFSPDWICETEARRVDNKSSRFNGTLLTPENAFLGILPVLSVQTTHHSEIGPFARIGRGGINTRETRLRPGIEST